VNLLRIRESERGTLLAIGGSEKKTDETPILERFVSLCGGGDARIMVVSTASSDPSGKVAEYDAVFRARGAGDVAFVHPQSRAEAQDPKLLATLERATGVFIVGGNQLKLVSELAGSPLIERMRERYRTGLHIGGTSAGASALGTVMIARGRARSAARLDSPRMTPGFGLLPNLILDQHFRERDRIGRLLAAVLCNPSYLGLGLDENTGLVVDAEDRLSVIGTGSVTVVDGSGLEENDIGVVPEESPAGFAGMRLHVLTEGWTYDVVDGRAARPAPVREEAVADRLSSEEIESLIASGS
jgi:cyanophycinase